MKEDGRLLELRNISIKLKKNERLLIKNLNFVLNQVDRVAIIGEEGNGKTTLLRMIYDDKLIDDYCLHEGRIIKKDITIGYLEQSLNKDWNGKTVYEYLLNDNPNDEIDYEKYNDLGYYNSILSKLKLSPKLIEDNQLIGTLSGGEKVKIQLAKLIFSRPNLLLLDEPTNDLDIETLEWLEDFINSSNVPLIFISHDETLLEKTANVIIHLEQIDKKRDARHNIEKIGYKDYVEKRLGMISKQTQVAKKEKAEYQTTMEKWRDIYQKVDRDQENISRGDPHGARLLAKKIKSLKSQEKRFEKEKENMIELPDVEEAINFSFEDNIYVPNNKVILDITIERLMIGNRLLSSNINLKICGPRHVVIIGRNGIGKTTLFKEIYNTLKDRGDINFGYMPQSYEDLMDKDKTALSFLLRDSTRDSETKARTFMGSMKFTKDEMLSKIVDLSGGQKAKLFILKMILDNCNVLLLDEPTRNLSPLSNPVIREALAGYTGTIISISHDRKYINEVCDVIYELTEDGIKNYK